MPLEDQLIQEHGELFIQEQLSSFITEERQHRIEEVLSRRLTSLRVAVEDPADPHNALAIVRTAEAFGISHFHAIGWPKKRGTGLGITRGTQRWTELQRHDSWDEFKAATPDYLIAGACVEQGTPLPELPLDKPLVLLFGNEQDGLKEETKKACDLLFTIPMQGMVESFNISVAAGITLYDTTQRRREVIEKEGELHGNELSLWRTRYWLRAIGVEKAAQILKHQKHSSLLNL